MVLTGTGLVVLARGRAIWSPNLIITSLCLIGALLLGAIIIAVASRWRRRSGQEGLSPGEQLAHFRSLYEEGTISAAEFARLRALLTGPVHEAAGGKKPSSATSPEPGSPPPSNGQPPPEDGIQPA
jgi:hypothetical protein